MLASGLQRLVDLALHGMRAMPHGETAMARPRASTRKSPDVVAGPCRQSGQSKSGINEYPWGWDSTRIAERWKGDTGQENFNLRLKPSPRSSRYVEGGPVLRTPANTTRSLPKSAKPIQTARSEPERRTRRSKEKSVPP